MERHDLDEYLETLWHLLENNESDIDNLKRHTKDPFDQEIFEALKVMQNPEDNNLKNSALAFYTGNEK